MGVSRPAAHTWRHRFEQSGRAGRGDHPPPAATQPGPQPARDRGRDPSAARRAQAQGGAHRRPAGRARPHGPPGRAVPGAQPIVLARSAHRMRDPAHPCRSSGRAGADRRQKARADPDRRWQLAHRRGRRPHRTRPAGVDDVRPAVDACSHHACARGFFWADGIRIEGVLTDNARNDTSYRCLGALGAVAHRRIRPDTPRINGEIARYDRALRDERTHAPAPHTASAPRRGPLACPPIGTTDSAPPSAAHPSAGSTTLRVVTASRCRSPPPCRRTPLGRAPGARAVRRWCERSRADGAGQRRG